MRMRTTEEWLKLTKQTILKAKDIHCRMADENGRYTISGLTEDEIGCIWHALSIYESLLKEEKDV